ncbi:MAG: hypothetical protein ACXW2E_01435 [Nitrososphaeraceae archaeon]
MTKPIIWLDLEDTIIDSWKVGQLTFHIHSINKYLKDMNIKFVHIFSFAICNHPDKIDFIDSGMKLNIELAIECLIHEYPSVEEIHQKVFEYEGIRYDSLYEFIQINGKHWSFIKFCMYTQMGKHSILIDDAVPSWIINDPKSNTTIQLLNIKDIC